jgi:hypothetical protein
MKSETLMQLAASMDQLENDIPIIASNIARDVADRIANDLVEVTPVDVGDAMSGWIVTLDTPASDIQLAFAPSPKGRWRPPWTHAVDPLITFFANVGQATEAIRLALEAKQPGQSIWIVNNLPYIDVLNTGTSKQEPGGFVERAMLLAEIVVGNAKLVI